MLSLWNAVLWVLGGVQDRRSKHCIGSRPSLANQYFIIWCEGREVSASSCATGLVVKESHMPQFLTTLFAHLRLWDTDSKTWLMLVLLYLSSPLPLTYVFPVSPPRPLMPTFYHRPLTKSGQICGNEWLLTHIPHPTPRSFLQNQERRRSDSPTPFKLEQRGEMKLRAKYTDETFFYSTSS